MPKLVLLIFLSLCGLASFSQEGVYYSMDDALQNPEGVRILILANQNLENLPESINEFKNLEELVLSGNQLNSIPPLNQCVKLNSIDVSGNTTIDFVSVCNALEFTSVKELVAVNNNLTFLPREIGKLKTLRKLDLSNNSIERLTDQLWNLYRLESFNIANNKVKALNKEISGLQRLKRLNVSSNPIDPSLAINTLMFLPLDELTWNSISYIPAEFELLKVRKLSVKGVNSLQIDPEFYRNQSIKTLNLSHADLGSNGEALTQIKEMKQLESLILKGTKLSSMSKITLPNLRYLDISGNQLSKTHIELYKGKYPNTEVIFKNKRSGTLIIKKKDSTIPDLDSSFLQLPNTWRNPSQPPVDMRAYQDSFQVDLIEVYYPRIDIALKKNRRKEQITLSISPLKGKFHRNDIVMPNNHYKAMRKYNFKYAGFNYAHDVALLDSIRKLNRYANGRSIDRRTGVYSKGMPNIIRDVYFTIDKENDAILMNLVVFTDTIVLPTYPEVKGSKPDKIQSKTAQVYNRLVESHEETAKQQAIIKSEIDETIRLYQEMMRGKQVDLSKAKMLRVDQNKEIIIRDARNVPANRKNDIVFLDDYIPPNQVKLRVGYKNDSTGVTIMPKQFYLFDYTKNSITAGQPYFCDDKTISGRRAKNVNFLNTSDNCLVVIMDNNTIGFADIGTFRNYCMMSLRWEMPLKVVNLGATDISTIRDYVSKNK